MVGDTSKVLAQLLLMSNRTSHMRFRLTPRSMTLDDLELRNNSLGISRDFADLGANYNG